MEFDRIYAEVDLGRIEENMKAMKEHLRPGTKMYGVVKTDAYGHGAVPVARTIDRFVCGYAVATVDEGLKLRRHGIEKEILCLGPVSAGRYQECLENDIFTWIRYKKPDVSMSLNGTLAGLVIVTASTDCIDMYGAAIEGIIAGIAVVLVIEFIDKVCKVDDPVGAVGVHFANGLLGTICVGLFSTGQNGVGAGLFYGGGFKQLGIQLLGVVTVCTWVGITMIIVFEVLKHTIGLRVPADIEIKGLDYAEHGLASAYSGFEFAANDLTIASDDEIEVFGSEKLENAVPAVVKTSPEKENKITKVEILAKQSKFEKLKKAMNDIGVTGMTVTQVLGCGTQKGAPEYYRGVEVDMQLLPKIQVEMVVSKVPVADVIDAARKALYTGHIGDGKIFVYDVEDVVKVRTGETGYDALQGADD